MASRWDKYKEKKKLKNSSPGTRKEKRGRSDSIPPGARVHPENQEVQRAFTQNVLGEDTVHRLRSLPRAASELSEHKSEPSRPVRRSLSIGERCSENHGAQDMQNKDEEKNKSKKKAKKQFSLANPTFDTDFVTISKLPSSGISCVYQVQEKENPAQYYAIKKIRFPHFQDSVSSYDKILQDVEGVIALSHPNIVQYYKVWIEIDEQGLSPADKVDYSIQLTANLLPFRNCTADEMSLSESVDSSITAITFTEYALTSDTDAFDDDPTDDATETDFNPDSNPFGHDDNPILSPEGFPTKAVNLFAQMEFCHFSLQDYLDHRKTVNEKYSFLVFTQILIGMKHIHSKNIIHRNLKPSNIFIQTKSKFSENKNDLVKIGNFTISIDEQVPFVFSRKDELNNSDEVQNASGSEDPKDFMYHSPEMRTGDKISAASDMYSIGVVLFELFFRTQSNNRDRVLKDLRKRILPSSLLLNYPNVSAVILWLMSPHADRPKASDVLECKLFENQIREHVVVNKKQLEDLDKRIQSQESTIHQQENIIKEQERKIKELMSVKELRSSSHDN